MGGAVSIGTTAAPGLLSVFSEDEVGLSIESTGEEAIGIQISTSAEGMAALDASVNSLDSAAITASANGAATTAIIASANGIPGAYAPPNHGGMFYASGTDGVGILGHVEGNSAIGVHGESDGPAGTAVYGKVAAANGKAVHGQSTDPSGYGGYFQGRGYFSGDVGIGTSTPNHKLEVIHATSGESAIFAEHTLASDDTPDIFGEHAGTDGRGIGVQGWGGYKGVEGYADRASGPAYGVMGRAGRASTGNSYGVLGSVFGAGTNYGVLGQANLGTTNWAGYFPTGNGYFGGSVGIGTTVMGDDRLKVHKVLGPGSAIHAEYVGEGTAIFGEATDVGGVGVVGHGGLLGVDGVVTCSGGYSGGLTGVSGLVQGTSSGGWNYGVRGQTTVVGSGSNIGVRGDASGGSINWAGYFNGNAHFSGNVGIGTTSVGDHKLKVRHGAWDESAIFTEHTLQDGDTPAILGQRTSEVDNIGIGVKGVGGWTGVLGSVNHSVGTAYGVKGEVTGTSTDVSYGLYGEAQAFGRNYGVYGWAGNGTTNWSGYFSGNVHVNGTLSKGGGSFKIDHPLDPENKYLYHSFVESPDMMNVYNGNVVLDENGEATVEMAEWFDTLNRDFRYQLTAIGAPGPNLYVSEEMSNNKFKIAGGNTWNQTSALRAHEGGAHAAVCDLFWQSEHLIAATHGRGMYDSVGDTRIHRTTRAWRPADFSAMLSLRV